MRTLTVTFCACAGLMLAHSQLVNAAPPASKLQRALENRARLMDRPGAQVHGQSDAAAAAAANGHSNGNSVSAEASVRARIATEIQPGFTRRPAGTGNGIGQDRARELRELDNRSKVKVGKGAGIAAQHRRNEDRPTAPSGQDSVEPGPGPGAEVKVNENGEFDLARADRILAHRLAQIDRMRDRALESGDEKLLERADALETIARNQYNRRTGITVEGTTETEADGVTQVSAQTESRRPFFKRPKAELGAHPSVSTEAGASAAGSVDTDTRP